MEGLAVRHLHVGNPFVVLIEPAAVFHQTLHESFPARSPFFIDCRQSRLARKPGTAPGRTQMGRIGHRSLGSVEDIGMLGRTRIRIGKSVCPEAGPDCLPQVGEEGPRVSRRYTWAPPARRGRGSVLLSHPHPHQRPHPYATRPPGPPPSPPGERAGNPPQGRGVRGGRRHF